jgi:hypothetical protein
LQFVREPLLHFFVLGAGIFAANAWLSEGGGDRELVVTRGQQTNLIETFERTWHRPPAQEEFANLLRDFIRQEIAYREAGKMELDRDDIVIRRRLRQKLELLTEDLASLAPPTEVELDAWYTEHAESYRTEPRYSFEQIFFNTDRRGATAREDAEALLSRLESVANGLDLAQAGDPTLLPGHVSDAAQSEVAASLGSDFADSLAELPIDAWAGPVASGFGLHLVRISSRVEGRLPERTEVAQAVLNDLSSDRRNRAVDTLYASLAEQYEIRVEPLDVTEK